MTRHELAERKMNCMQVGRALQSYLDGHVDDLTERRIAAHLEDCRRCGLEESAYRDLKAALARRAEHLDTEPLDRLRAFSQRLAAGDVPAGPDSDQPDD